MARQKGLIALEGTLGDVNCYVSKGVALARKAGGGFNGDAIKTKASMQRLRENAFEFGHCNRLKKQFRVALLPFLKDLKGKAFHARQMQLFLALKALDAVSERGARTVAQGLNTVKGQRLLRSFEFTPQSTLMQAVYDHTTFDWVTQQVQITDLDVTDFKAPKAATHLGVTLGILDFDFETLDSSLRISPTYYLPIIAGTSSFVNQPNAVIGVAHTGVAILSVRYYEVISGAFYGLDSATGVRVLGCLY